MIVMLFTVFTLTVSLPTTNQKEGKSNNVLRSIIKGITGERNNDNVIENVESPKPVIGLKPQPIADPDPDKDADQDADADTDADPDQDADDYENLDAEPGLLGLALGCSHIPVFGCLVGLASSL